MKADKDVSKQPEVQDRFLACPHLPSNSVFSFDVTHQAFRSRRLQAHHCNWNHLLSALTFHSSQLGVYTLASGTIFLQHVACQRSASHTATP
jgi:hypothetical protein